MNRLHLLFAALSLLAFLPFCAHADFITVSGDVSGIWSADTVIVTAEVRVPPGETLQIMPGVEVLFQVYCKFIVDSAATLLAVGLEEDSIRFDELTEGTHWHGIRFSHSSHNCRIEYCNVSNGMASGGGEDSKGGAIYCHYSNPAIVCCSISGCMAESGGGIYCDYSSPMIVSNSLRRNSTTGLHGGAIYCSYSNPSISRNEICENRAYYDGGGIYCHASYPVIELNCLDHNWALTATGGAITCSSNSDALIRANLIFRNSADSEGGGISCLYSASPEITSNLIIENSCYSGGGVYCCLDCQPIIAHNYIIGNYCNLGGGIRAGWTSQPYVHENFILANYASWEGGGIYSRTGTLTNFQHNIICGNSSGEYGGGISCDQIYDFSHNVVCLNSAEIGGGIYIASQSFVMQNSIFWDNTNQQIGMSSYASPTVAYCDIQDTVWPGTGNISADPMFINPDQDDYRLLWGSPCIDSGDPDPIYNDPDSTRSDMGAFYYDQSVPVRVLLTPYGAPIQIPPEGGSFDYMITASNCTNSPLPADFWCDATLPGDSLVGPLLGPIAATIPADSNMSILRTQRVPGASGSGIPKAITYNGYAAVGVDTSKDSFIFWRMALGSGDLGLVAGDWSNWGESFPGEDLLPFSLYPSSFRLYPASPNPFNATTTIRFDLPVACRVRLDIFDVAGRRAASPLQGGWREAGSHEVTFAASNWASGIYLYRLKAGNFEAVGKMVLLK